MKRYDIYSLGDWDEDFEMNNAHESNDGFWVPAEVAQALYDALVDLAEASDRRALYGRNHVPSMRAEQDARLAARKALSLADGEE